MTTNMRNNTSNNTPLWMCLYFTKLPLEVFLRSNTSEENAEDHVVVIAKKQPVVIAKKQPVVIAKKQPVVIAQKQPVVITEKQRVFHMNDMAKEVGIQIGNSMDTAYTFSNNVLCFERNDDRETSTLAHLAQWAYQFTPKVSIKSPDCLLLDIGGCLKLFKGLNNLILSIEQGLHKLGYQALIATNTTPLSALIIARAHVTNSITPNLITPNLIHTDHDKLENSIGQLSVQNLQAEEKIITALEQMGIVNLHTLLGLPTEGISRRLGTYFNDYLLRLKGEKADPQKIINPNARFLSSINFLFDITNLNSLIFPIKRLLGELSDFLKGRQLTINHFTWHLSHQNSPHSGSLHKKHFKKTFSISLSSPINETRVFLALTQLKLDQINDVKEVDSITLIVNRFYPLSADSKGLFQDSYTPSRDFNGRNSEHNDQLLNILNAKLGPGQYFGLSQSDDHRPEKAWKKVNLSKKQHWSPEKQDSLLRPSFLLTTPKALAMSGDMPRLAGQLTLLKGPERIDYGWWDETENKPLTRDYYIASQKDGTLYWIFKYITMDQWYLHGIFS